jgi:hypothetical protein
LVGWGRRGCFGFILITTLGGKEEKKEGNYEMELS